MKRIKIKQISLTFEEGCEKYIEYCKQRNLRQATIEHYRQSYKQFYYYFNPEMAIEEMTKEKYNGYILYLKEKLRQHRTVAKREKVWYNINVEILCPSKFTHGEDFLILKG